MIIRRHAIALCLPLLATVAGCASAPPAPAPPALTAAAAPPAGRSAGDAIYRYVDAMREDLSRGNFEIITEVMNLTAPESSVFWPIYQDYEAELFELGDQRVELIRQFAAAQQAHRLDNATATRLADGYFQFESARLELVKKYHATIAQALSPLRAAQFTQVEHRVGTVIDLLIASELPLIPPRPAN